MKPFFVYMLRCNDQSYYVGHTDDLERRLQRHGDGMVDGYTSTRRPAVLVWCTEADSRDEALRWELQVKRWSRAKKEALMEGDWPRLKVLARGPDRLRPSTTPVPSVGAKRRSRGARDERSLETVGTGDGSAAGVDDPRGKAGRDA